MVVRRQTTASRCVDMWVAPRVGARATVAPRARERRSTTKTTRASASSSWADACGYDPARKAVELVSRLHTLAAIRVIMAQSDGAGNECSEDVNQSSLTASLLRELERAPLVGDGSAFIEELMRGDDADLRLCAARIIEVRRTYGEESFDWDEVRRETMASLETNRMDLLRAHATASLKEEA